MGTKLLLLDFHSEPGYGPMRQEAAEPCRFEMVEMRRPAPDGGAGAAPAGEPDLVAVVLSPRLLESPGELLRSLRRRLPQAPFVALLEAGLRERIRPEAGEAARLKETLGLRHLVGESASFLAAIEKIPLVARCEASVLVCGETGTGKELIARAIHALSPRSHKPFLAVNCGAIPTELMENELFGHERAAFTGAFQQQAGVVQEAEGGTLFLDEIDSLPLLAQVKLLRLLQEKEYRPLGSARPRRADVRILAATNGDLENAVRQGKMRQDLYYRLNVIPLQLPALRERRDDIPRLAHHFLAVHAHGRDTPCLGFTPRALQALLDYDWPGNVRELEHVVERAAVLSHGEDLIRERHIHLPRPPASPVPQSFQSAKASAVARFEADYIRELLLAHQGNISRAAKAADKNRRAFWELIRKHGIDARSFRPV